MDWLWDISVIDGPLPWAILLLGALGLLWVFMVICGFADNAASGLLALIIGPVLILLYLVFIRMTLEFYVAIVRMSEDIHQRLR